MIDVRNIAPVAISPQLPRQLLQLGLVIIVLCLFMLGTIAWMLNYKEVVKAEAMLYSAGKPENVVTESSGKIILLKNDEDSVSRGDAIAYIENGARYDDVVSLKAFAEAAKHAADPVGLIEKKHQRLKTMQLGELQTPVISILAAFEEYQLLNTGGNRRKSLQAIEQQVSLYEERLKTLREEMSVIDKVVWISKKEYEADKKLFEQQVVSEKDFNRSKQAYLIRQQEMLRHQSSIQSTRIQLEQARHEKTETERTILVDQEKLRQTVSLQVLKLTQDLEVWEKKYVLRADMAGACSFSGDLKSYEYVKQGEPVATIVPANPKAGVRGVLKFPVAGSGKVCPGQVVNIRFDNYPYQEFGVIRGRIEKIALVPSGKQYTAVLSFPEGLVSTYKKQLEFREMMQGNAEIVTNESNLYRRIWNALKSGRLNR